MNRDTHEAPTGAARRVPTIGELKAIIPPLRSPFWVSWLFHRRVSPYLSWIFIRLGISANTVTLLSGVAAFAAAVLFVLPNPVSWVVAAVLVQAYFLLDCADGEISRYERHCGDHRSGTSGIFYDTCCHASNLALTTAVGLRLFFDLGGPWWIALLIIVFLFPGSIGPWQRYCESLVVHGARRARGQDVTIPGQYAEMASLSLAPSEFEDAPRPSALQTLRRQIMQTVGFPGYLTTLSVCALLDVFPGVPTIQLNDQPVPYLLIWLFVRALHAAMAGLKSTAAYGRRLRSLR